MVPPCFCLNGGFCQDRACVCPNEWVGQFCDIGQYKQGSTSKWCYVCSSLCFGRLMTPLLSPHHCSAGSGVQAVMWFVLLGEAVYFTHFCHSFEWVIYLGKILRVSAVCGLFLANLAFVWIPLFQHHSDLKIWVRSQGPVFLSLDLLVPRGRYSALHYWGDCSLLSSCYHSHKFWVSQISDTWCSTGLAASHFRLLCHSIAFLRWCKRRGCSQMITRAGKTSQHTLLEVTTCSVTTLTCR